MEKISLSLDVNMHMLHGICAYLAASEGFGVLWFEQSYVALAGELP